MPIARFQMPDGRIARFEVPEGTSPEEAQALMEQAVASGAAAGKQAQPKSGFLPAMKAGWENLKGDIAGLAGRSGLMAIQDAEAQQARNKAEAARIYKPTEGTWFDSPGAKFAETLGGSVPYMAAPVVAGGAAAFAGAPALAAAGAAGLTSAAQFTGSNLSRQQDTGKKLADTDLASAAGAAVPQALLDVVGFKMIPGIRRIFAAAGKELTPQAAAEIAKAGLKSTVADYAKSGIKASGVEGLTEAGQTVFERLQAGLALNDEAAREEYLQSFIGGVALGGTLSVPGRFHERGREQLQAAQVEEQKQIKAEQDAAALQQQQEAQQAEQRKDPAYAADVADRYQKAEATYRSMLPGKLDKNADEATKFEHAQRAKQAKEFLEAELKPLIPEYLAVKPVLQAAQPPAAAAPAPNAEPTVEEEAGLLFPLAPTNLQPPGPGVPTADEVEAQRAELAGQQQALDVHLETLRDQAAKAAQAGDTATAIRLSNQFKQAEQARDAAAQQIAALPKAPKNVDLAKQLEKAQKALALAGENGDPDAILRAAAKVEKLKSQGAELMQPGPEMEMVPAGGKSESQAEFFPKVATDTLAPKPLQLPFDATKIAVPDRGQGPARLPYDPGTDVRAMEANRMDTSQTAQPDLLAGVPQRPQTVNDKDVPTNRPEVAGSDVEMKTQVKQGVGDVSTKSRAQLLADLQIARASMNASPGRRGGRETAAAREAIEGLRDLKAREDAERAKPGPDVSNPAGSQLAAAMGSRMPGNVAKQQAARDAVYRAYGNFVSILNRFNKGLAKREERDLARKQVLDNLIDDIGVTRGLPLTAPEADAVRKEAARSLTELQDRFGDTRDVINQGTKEKPDMAPVQERDGTFIRDRIERPQGTANVESRGTQPKTFDRPYASAQALLEEIEQVRNNAINGTPGVPGVVGKQTPTTTSPEALNEALAKAKPGPLVDRLKDNLPAFASDPGRRNLAAEWLYKESTGQANDAGAAVTAELDRLEQGKRSETEGGKTAVQSEMFADKGTLFDTFEEFDAYLASDAVKEMRAAAGPVMDTMSRIHQRAAPLERRVAELKANIANLQKQRAGVQTKGAEQAAAAEKRIAAAQAKLDSLLAAVETKLEPLRAEAREAQQALQDAYQVIADVEARIGANMAKFSDQFPSDSYVAAAMDTLEKARAKHIALINEPDAVANIQQGIFLRPDVIAAGKRVNEALVDAMKALQKEPSSRAVQAFLNRDLALQLELQEAQALVADAQAGVKQADNFVEMGTKVFEANIRKSPEGAAAQRELRTAKTTAENARNKREGKLKALSEDINKLGDELDAYTKALTSDLQPALKRAADRANPAAPEDLEAKANAERKAENDRLERLADIPGEQVTFTDLAAVADKFAELPEKVARLEGKAADETLPATTRAKAKTDAKKFRTRMETLYGLLSDDPQTVNTARDAAQKQLDDVKARIDAKKQAINADGVTDKVRLSRTAELYDLRSELRDLQKFVDGFGKKVKRTPVETREERKERLAGAAAVEGTRLPASKQGPLMKKETVAGNVRTGDLTTVGERTLSPRNPIVQGGQTRSPTSTQAQRGAAKDTAYEAAMLKLGKIEDLKERNDDALAKAAENNDPKLAKYQEFDARLTAALAAQQKVVDATTTGKRKAKAVTDVEVDDVTDTIKDYWGKKDAKPTYAEPGEARRIADARERGGLPGLAPATMTDLSTALADDVRDGRIMDAVDRLSSEGSTPEVQAAARKLKPFLLRTKLRTQAGLMHKGERVAGMYYQDTNTVVLDADSMSEETLLHELTHAATSRALRTPDADLTPEQVAAKREIAGLFNAIKGRKDLAGEYGITDIDEFVAEVYSNRDFQAKLNKIGTPRSLLARFVDAVRRLFGFGPRDPAGTKMRDAVEKIMMPSQVRKGGAALPAAKKPSPYAVASVFAAPRTFKERMGGNLALAAEMHTVDMRAPVREALATGNKRLADQAMYYIRKNDARMPQVYSVFQHGALGLKQDARGRYVVEAGNSKSVQDVFKAIAALPGKDAADKMTTAQAYLTAKRALANPKAAFALDLGKGGLTPEVLAADMRKLTADPTQKEALENIARVYADLNRGLIGFLQETGAISKDEAADYVSDDSYVPYYRVRGDGVAELVFDETKTLRLGDIRTQPYLKALEGGDAQLLPLNEAITRNVMLLTDMGMRNLTTKNVAYALQDIGKSAKKMQIRTGDGKADVKALRFQQDGKPYHIIVDTEGTPAEGIPGDMVARSLEGSYTVIPSFLKAFGWAGDVLRAGVTRNPMYVARQLFRDPFAASFTGGLERGPLTAVAKAMASFVRQTAGRKDATAEALVRKGVVQSGIFSGDPDDLSKMSLQLAGGDSGAFNKLFSAMDRAAMRADSVTRQQMYDDVLKRTGSEMEAEMAAMEMMNFSKRGLSPTVQYASRMIPFFNAQIQGLNVLHKAMTGKATMQERLGIQQKFWDRAGLLMAGTLIYAMAMEDDDTYKNARASDKYANWFVPLSRDPADPKNDVTLKLPIPFEVGLLFKAVPEALADYMRGTSTEQEWKAIRNLFLNQIPGGSSFMLPQLAKPLIEVGTNHSFFTGREIEGSAMKGVDPQERYTARTTELAKRMSEMLQSDLTPDALKLSPLQIEHLARGYLGSLPLMAAATMNDIFGTPNAEAPTRKLTETPLVGTSFQDRYGNGAADILYAKIKAADQVQTTYNKMLNEGRKQDAKMYLADVENLRELPMLRQAESKLQLLAKQEKAIRSSANLDPDTKRERLDAITARREQESRKYLDAVAAVAR